MTKIIGISLVKQYAQLQSNQKCSLVINPLEIQFIQKFIFLLSLAKPGTPMSPTYQVGSSQPQQIMYPNSMVMIMIS
jgi:hypothetical protein